MKRDPYASKDHYLAWREHGTVEGVSLDSARALVAFLDDMEAGRNVGIGTKRGGRSYVRLNALRHKLTFLARTLEHRSRVPSLLAVTEEQVHAMFAAMRRGELRRRDGSVYQSTGDYVKVFKTFWRWHMKIQRKQGTPVEDLCVDLDHRSEQPPWVYLTVEQVDSLCRAAKFEYRMLMMFLYDSGIRSPTELLNVRARDLTDDCTQLHIREETSKTFGRTIKLLLCADLLRTYLKERQIGPDEYVFNLTPAGANKYLKRLATRVLGTAVSPSGKPYSRLTLYDFRHSSACYWLPRYKSESALKYRFGWKKSEMIHYYTGFLGMRDTITEDDLLLSQERSAIERALEASTRDKTMLGERVDSLEQQMSQILRALRAARDQSTSPSVEAVLERDAP